MSTGASAGCSCAAALCAMLVPFSSGLAQQGAAENAEQAAPARELEEVVVKGQRSGDPVDVQARYEELLRDQVFSEYGELRKGREEEQWRSELPTSLDRSSRVKWGYDPQAELRLRRDSEMLELPSHDVKPATLFRFKF